MKYVCTICGFVFDEEKGIPEKGISAGTKWEDLPSDWKCPMCGAPKSAFKKLENIENTKNNTNLKENNEIHELKELSFGETAALLSSLAVGCEKQYLFKQAEELKKLSEIYFSKCANEKTDYKTLINKVSESLNKYDVEMEVAKENFDRGALRVLVWGQKVTAIINSLMQSLENSTVTNVYVCEICGFIYVGNSLPEVCPVCKVPNFKFKKIERGA